MSVKLLTPISHLFHIKKDMLEIVELSDELEARERTCDLNVDNTTHYHIDFDLNIGLTDNQIKFLEKYVKPNEKIQTLTFQAARDCEEVELKDNKYFPKSKPLDLKIQVENTKISTNKIRDIVGNFRKIGIENNNFYNTGAYLICTSPEYILESCEKANLNLLFDYAHAMVTCINGKTNFESYANKLLENITCNQFHLCEPTFFYDESGVHAVDSHNLPSPVSTYSALDLMKKYSAEFLTIEYYREPENLIKYLNYLKGLI